MSLFRPEKNADEGPMTDAERARIRARLAELGLRFEAYRPGEDYEDDEDDEGRWEDWP